MRITRLQIRQYRGIEALDTELPAAGAVVAGKNGGGKTSCLRAIQAALAARGVDPNSIRLGADKAEILVDLDNVTVRRVITQKGSSVTVTNQDGFKANKPQTYLDELLGGAAIDPIELFLAKPADRRKQILAALPVSVTLDELRQWAPTVPDSFDCSGHGLDVVARVHKAAYDKRTAANAEAKAKRAAADSARDAADAAKKGLPADPPSLEDARAAEHLARAGRAALAARAAEHAAAEQRTVGVREKAQKLRADADAITIPVIDEDAATELAREWESAGDLVSRLRAELTTAEAKHKLLGSRLDDIANTRERAKVATKQADDLRARAAMIEETIGDVAAKAPTEDEIAAADLEVEARARALEIAQAAATAAALATDAERRSREAEAAELEAARLDAMVKALANEAPAKLIAKSNGIEGLSIDGDVIKLDGKAIDDLCGAEQLRFAVEIAKRANGKTKLLLCDGVERLDPDQMQSFLEFATADGWQLVATRVSAGEVRIEAIERDLAAEAAE